MMPRPIVMILGFLVFAILLGFIVIKNPEMDYLLILLMIPPVFSALHYSRIVPITSIIIAFLISSWVIFTSGSNIYGSMQTSLMLACTLVVISEIIYYATLAKNRAEATLRQKENDSRSIIENSLDIITSIHIDGTIRYVNPSVKRALDFSPSEISNQSIFKLVHPDDISLLKKEFEVAYDNQGEPKFVQLRILHKDNSWRWFESVVVDHTENSEIRGYTIHSRDITERIKNSEEKESLESDLRQVQKIEALGRLAGGIAHDFNNLLTVITGYAKVVLKSIDPENPLVPKIVEIMKAGERGSSLTRQLLTFSRKQVFTPVPINLNKILLSMKGMLERLIDENIELLTVLHPELGMIIADPTQLEQVVMNLCINARDAMPNGGKLIIETKNVSITPEEASKLIDAKPGIYVQLTIIDTGQGMNQEVLSHLFEPFFTTKESGKGTGLGLATTYGIVKQSQGFIQIQSQPKQGSTFEIYFPSITQNITDVITECDTYIPRGSETVLLVEDDTEVRHLIRDLLREYGYQVIEAFHGGEAIQLCQNSGISFDILITDIIMPCKNGFEVAKQISTMVSGIKILYLTGHSLSTIIQNRITEDNIPLLKKPFTPDEFLIRVRQILDNSEKTPSKHH